MKLSYANIPEEAFLLEGPFLSIWVIANFSCFSNISACFNNGSKSISIVGSNEFNFERTAAADFESGKSLCASDNKLITG